MANQNKSIAQSTILFNQVPDGTLPAAVCAEVFELWPDDHTEGHYTKEEIFELCGGPLFHVKKEHGWIVFNFMTYDHHKEPRMTARAQPLDDGTWNVQYWD